MSLFLVGDSDSKLQNLTYKRRKKKNNGRLSEKKHMERIKRITQFYPLSLSHFTPAQPPPTTSNSGVSLVRASSSFAPTSTTPSTLNHMDNPTSSLIEQLETTWNLAELINENDTISQTLLLVIWHNTQSNVLCSVYHISNTWRRWGKINRKNQFRYFLKNTETKLMFFKSLYYIEYWP